MTTELFYLVLSALLLASLWIPFVVGVNMYDKNDLSVNMTRVLSPERLPMWVQRANRAHLNLVEQFPAFAALILVLHVLGVTTTVTVWAAGLYFWLRVAHAVVMWLGVAMPLRPVVFTASWICLLVLGWQALVA